MTPGIVLCSRVHSRRLPNKPLIKFNGKPVIWHLVNRLLKTGYPVCLATPMDAEDEILHTETMNLPIKRFRGHRDDVLARFFYAAYENKFDPVIRVTHDDLFVDPDMVRDMVKYLKEQNVDYTYVSKCLRGADAEVVSFNGLKSVFSGDKGTTMEYLSYPFRSLSMSEYVPETDRMFLNGERLSLDWPEDEKAIRVVFEMLSDTVDSYALYSLLRYCPSILDINRLPAVTVYTAAYNAEKTVAYAINSVLSQGFRDFEYMIVDDGSTDKTLHEIMRFSSDPRVKIIRQADNTGLSSASNRALRDARGKYVIRIDADDELLPDGLKALYNEITRTGVAAVYPNYIRHGAVVENREHHTGGAIFRASAYHETRFYDGLRHFESKDFYNRFVKKFKVGYLDTPTWHYHETAGSLSSVMTDQRKEQLGFINGTND